jgi:acyl-CoA synthetase (NDP forming)
MPDRISQPFRDAGLAVFLTETEAIGALGSLLGLHGRLARARERFDQLHAPRRAERGEGRGRVLDEAESMAFLAARGVPVVEHRRCRSADEAVDAFRALGGAPVAVKGCTADVTHKSELGIVRLGVSTEDDVRKAFDEVAAANGAVVARMVHGQRELLLGAHHDPTFGPVVLLGDGGRYVEALPDIQVLFPRFDADDALAALSRLRVAPVLRGTRGEPAVDLPAVAAAAVALGATVDDVASVDVNPLMAGPDGCVAVDAVVILPD